MSKFISPRFDSLQAYVPGEQPRERKYIKLNTNESPYPPSASVVSAAENAAKSCNLYSDPTLSGIRSRVSGLYGVGSENVFVTNGSDEALSFAFMTFCDKETGAAFPDITYGFYRVFGQLYELCCLEIPLKDDFSIDIKDYYNIGKTIFIANPNAPTGIALPLSDIESIVRNNPQNIVVIDEAYIDFGGESAVPLTKKYDNLMVIQTFSKSRSLAGARIGFAVADRSIIADLEKLRYSTNPYNVNAMSIAAGCAALDENGYYMLQCKKIKESRAVMTEGLHRLGFFTTESAANFVFARHPSLSGEELYNRLRARGILVRHFKDERIKDYNRITVGTSEEVQTLLSACRDIIQQKQ